MSNKSKSRKTKKNPQQLEFKRGCTRFLQQLYIADSSAFSGAVVENSKSVPGVKNSSPLEQRIIRHVLLGISEQHPELWNGWVGIFYKVKEGEPVKYDSKALTANGKIAANEFSPVLTTAIKEGIEEAGIDNVAGWAWVVSCDPEIDMGEMSEQYVKYFVDEGITDPKQCSAMSEIRKLSNMRKASEPVEDLAKYLVPAKQHLAEANIKI